MELSQLPDLSSTQITEEPQQQQPQHFTITTTAPPQQQQSPRQPSSQGGSLTCQALFRATQIFQKQLFSCKLFHFPSQNITVQYKYLSQEKKSNTYTTPNMKQITHGTPNMANNQPIFSLKSMGLVKIFNKKVQHLHHP